MVALPVWPELGLTLTVRVEPLPLNVMPVDGTRVELEDLAVTARLPAGVCASPTVNANGPVEVPALMVQELILLIVGGVLIATALTVNAKLVTVVRMPSLTMRSIWVVPGLPAA